MLHEALRFTNIDNELEYAFLYDDEDSDTAIILGLYGNEYREWFSYLTIEESFETLASLIGENGQIDSLDNLEQWQDTLINQVELGLDTQLFNNFKQALDKWKEGIVD